ncbi:DUF5753 domain-containing protein [Lentzea flava]|uniref:DUF5753 domain-containing protein n=1 Tax=Lentzea flava TaxID=103732 RepID=A0ABQ2UBJ0_9PSEU|nr:DUF5753 domain-containing protein [Lentzea flava]MCP2196846.1 hypothetical protein [Lentzea flava]GGU15065.1 hypothetical protein GCM10010178_03210 [Lentzea flava]
MSRKASAFPYKGFKSNLQHRAVARALASWREESGKSLKEASDAAKWSVAKTSMMQNAAYPISEFDVAILALVYGIEDDKRAAVYHGAQRARDPQAYDRLPGAEPCIGWVYGEIAVEASHLRIVATDAFPYVVRTEGYADAVQNYCADSTTLWQRHQYGSTVREHITRRLLQEESLHLHLVVSETLLRCVVGNALVMVDQLLWLMELTQRPNIKIQVTPNSVGRLAAASPFSIMTFREDRFDDVVYIENPHGSTWLEAQDALEPYASIFDRLATNALSTDDTVEYIAEAAHLLQATNAEV